MPWTSGVVANFVDVLQALIDFCCGDKYQQSIGAAPLQTLNFTLANTPVAKGQIRVMLKQDTTEFELWDTGETTDSWVHPDITSSSMNYTTGVGQIVLANPLPTGFTAVADYVVGKGGGLEGRDWILLQDRDTTDNLGGNPYTPGLYRECWMKNSGVTYKEPIYIGFREWAYTPLTMYNWNLNVDHQLGIPPDDNADWNFNKGTTTRDGYNATYENWTELPGVGLRDDSMGYWIFSNKNRICGVIRVTGTIYMSFYVGFGLRFSSAPRYPYALCAIGSTYGNRSFSDTSGFTNFILAPATLAMMLWELNNTVSNTSFQYLTPKKNGFSDQGVYTKATTGDIMLWEPFVWWWNGSVNSLLMQLDGVYFAMDDLFQSEDIVQIGGTDYFVAQDISRVTDKSYCLFEMG